jgi:DNA-binding NtrC family response regulator
VAVNCGALPENLVESELFGFCKGTFTGALTDRPGRFEAANHGTLFLDEVGELPPAAQVKLLRFLDTRQVERLGSVEPRQLDVRVVGATNCDLRKAVQENRFRADLFFRLSTVQIRVPPLRERRDDVPLLVRHFLAQLSPSGALPPLSPEALACLGAYDWPGNVRELRNAVEHALLVAAGGPILPSSLPESVRAGGSAWPAPVTPELLPLAAAAAACVQAAAHRVPPGRVQSAVFAAVERELLRCALARCSGNQSAAANWLGIHRNSLRRRLRELGIGDSTAAG